MSEEIFRKKSLDKMKSPENLDDYIKVANPGVWLLIACVIVLLIGACIWGIFGHVDSMAPGTVHVEDGSAVCLVKEDDIAGVAVDMTVRFGKNEAKIVKIETKDASGYACVLEGEFELPDGYYEGNVVKKSYKPLSFILN